MHWSAILVLAMVGMAGTNTATEDGNAASEAFSSYTDAWHAAHDAHRPMLLILNPADKEGISEQELRSDEHLQPVMEEYVVAVINTGTEHGKKVHELFESAPLPRVVVIDNEQKLQIFRTSEKLTHEKLADVLNRHKSGEGAKIQTVLRPANSVGSCPNCQRRLTF